MHAKTVLMRIHVIVDIIGRDGQAIKVEYNTVYLGALISSSGLATSELTLHNSRTCNRWVLEPTGYLWSLDRFCCEFKAFNDSQCIISFMLLYAACSRWVLAPTGYLWYVDRV